MRNQRLTVHLKKVKKFRVDGKSFIKNTLSFEVADETIESQTIT